MAICHPPCTYINSAGLHWIARGRIESDGRPRSVHRDEALAFVTLLWNAPVAKLVIENPVGCINSRLLFMPVPQYVQPYEYGDDASKRTGLWMRGLPPLKPTQYVEPRMVLEGGKLKPRWANQTDSGQNKLGPSATRGHERARTYPGIAEAMADQWGNLSILEASKH